MQPEEEEEKSKLNRFMLENNTAAAIEKVNIVSFMRDQSASAASRRFLTSMHNEVQHSECTQDVAFNAHVSKNTIQWTLSNIDHL